MKRLLFLFAVCAVVAHTGCGNPPLPARTAADEAATAAADSMPDGVERVRIGACYYVIVRGRSYSGTGTAGLAITHAADCPNHWRGTTQTGARRQTN